jgi:RNA polymerase sigma factor (sigma-70 family)
MKSKQFNPVVARFVDFQETGAGFEGVWADVGPIVEEFARRTLRKNGVKTPFGDDGWAVDDVVNQTAARLMDLAAPGAAGRFDPARASKPGLSGLRGWLSRIVERQAVDWTRNYRGGRKAAGVRSAKILTESSLVLNRVVGVDDGSLLKRQVAKPRRPDLLPMLDECIRQLPDAFLRTVIQLKLHEGLSERQTAKRLRVPVPRVHRGLHRAYAMLRPLLEDRGVDADWLTA